MRKIIQEKLYFVFRDSDGALAFTIRSYDGEPENPRFLFDGDRQAFVAPPRTGDPVGRVGKQNRRCVENDEKGAFFGNAGGFFRNHSSIRYCGDGNRPCRFGANANRSVRRRVY